MEEKTKKELLETLLYFSGMLKVLKRQSKKSNLKSYDEYCSEYDKVNNLIEKIKKM